MQDKHGLPGITACGGDIGTVFGNDDKAGDKDGRGTCTTDEASATINRGAKSAETAPAPTCPNAAWSSMPHAHEVHVGRVAEEGNAPRNRM